MEVLADVLALGRAKRDLPPPPLRRLIRQRAGVTQADIARLVGVSRPTVTRWENGRRDPRGEVLLAYVRLLDVLERER